jgi:hypothetical protein
MEQAARTLVSERTRDALERAYAEQEQRERAQ